MGSCSPLDTDKREPTSATQRAHFRLRNASIRQQATRVIARAGQAEVLATDLRRAVICSGESARLPCRRVGPSRRCARSRSSAPTGMRRHWYRVPPQPDFALTVGTGLPEISGRFTSQAGAATVASSLRRPERLPAAHDFTKHHWSHHRVASPHEHARKTTHVCNKNGSKFHPRQV